MEIRYSLHPEQVKRMTTDELREAFLLDDLFSGNPAKIVYSHDDRVIVGGICPREPYRLEGSRKDLGTDYFLERREIGIINIGAAGSVTVDGEKFSLKSKDGLYIGRGKQEVIFSSDDPQNPARFYFNSTPAHASYPTEHIEIGKAQPQKLGSQEESNTRTIYKYIHPEGVKSCQLVMGMTVLEPGNVWNTMPAHTHERRMEVYLYFDLPEDGIVFHYMGQPEETRHLVMQNEQAVISPSWSLHSGVGTRRYTFIWGMAGENQTFSDMDGIPLREMR